MIVGIILAAGKGTRMKSSLPKVLHEVCGVPMIELVRRALVEAGASRMVVVVSPENKEAIEECLADKMCEFVVQDPPKGTGHAAQIAAEKLKGFDGDVLLVCGDTPLLKASSLREMVRLRKVNNAKAVLAGFQCDHMSDYGRIKSNGNLATEIVETSDMDLNQRQQMTMANSAVYCFDSETLQRFLPLLKPNERKGEIFLTDIVADIHSSGHSVFMPPPMTEEEFIGVNDKWALSQASKIYRDRILQRMAMNGVTIIDPANTYIGADVLCEPDVTILPMCVIEGKTTIASGAQVGPNSWVKDSTICAGARVFMSHVDSATVGVNSRCGPFANLRPASELGENVKVGNFVEIKNAQLGDKVSVSHLTYIGDATVGSGSNIGAGTITCNYDGFEKHRTTIGSDTFIGSNSTLVAPVAIGDGAFVAAGSIITRDVPENDLAIARTKQENKPQWAEIWRSRKKLAKEGQLS